MKHCTIKMIVELQLTVYSLHQNKILQTLRWEPNQIILSLAKPTLMEGIMKRFQSRVPIRMLMVLQYNLCLIGFRSERLVYHQFYNLKQ